MLSMHMEQFGSSFIPFREVNSSGAWPGDYGGQTGCLAEFAEQHTLDGCAVPVCTGVPDAHHCAALAGKLLRLQSGGYTTVAPVHVDATASSSPSGSDCASSSHSSLQGPSQSVLQHLCPPGREAGARLLAAVQGARDALAHAQRQPGSNDARRDASDKLHAVHTCIVDLDHNLDEHHAAAAAAAPAATAATAATADGASPGRSDFGEGPRLSTHNTRSVLSAADTAVLRDCRQWLQHAQAYVLHVARQIDTLRARGDAVGEDEWRELFAEAHEDLSRTAEQMGAGGVLVRALTPHVAVHQLCAHLCCLH